MEYGKTIKTESYFNGRIKSTKVEYLMPELVQDKSQALQACMKAIELITTKQTHMLTIKIEADVKTHQFKLVTKQYVVDE